MVKKGRTLYYIRICQISLLGFFSLYGFISWSYHFRLFDRQTDLKLGLATLIPSFLLELIKKILCHKKEEYFAD
jgi:hypothetical protein